MATFSLCDSCTAHFTALSLSLLSSEMGRSFGSENNTVHAEAPHGAHYSRRQRETLEDTCKATVNEARGGGRGGSPRGGRGMPGGSHVQVPKSLGGNSTRRAPAPQEQQNQTTCSAATAKWFPIN